MDVKQVNFLKTLCFGFVGIAVMFGLNTVFSSRTKDAPDYAIVYLDLSKSTYFAPPCVNDEQKRWMKQATMKDVRSSSLKADGDCDAHTGFTQPDRSLAGQYMEKKGLLLAGLSRWNEDGRWNW